MLSLLSRGGFLQKSENVVKDFLTIISNGQCFKLFTLNQVIDEVNCGEQPGVTFLIYFVKYFIKEKLLKMSGDYFCNPKNRGLVHFK